VAFQYLSFSWSAPVLQNLRLHHWEHDTEIEIRSFLYRFPTTIQESKDYMLFKKRTIRRVLKCKDMEGTHLDKINVF